MWASISSQIITSNSKYKLYNVSVALQSNISRASVEPGYSNSTPIIYLLLDLQLLLDVIRPQSNIEIFQSSFFTLVDDYFQPSGRCCKFSKGICRQQILTSEQNHKKLFDVCFVLCIDQLCEYSKASVPTVSVKAVSQQGCFLTNDIHAAFAQITL